MIAAIKLARERFSIRTMTKAAGVSDHTLAAIVSDRKLVADIVLVRVSEAVGRLWVGLEMHTAEEAELVGMGSGTGGCRRVDKVWCTDRL